MSRIRRFWQKDYESEYGTISRIRRKKGKTKAERLLIKYFRIYAIISEVLVSYSKQEYSAEYALKEIRRYLEDI